MPVNFGTFVFVVIFGNTHFYQYIHDSRLLAKIFLNYSVFRYLILAHGRKGSISISFIKNGLNLNENYLILFASLFYVMSGFNILLLTVKCCKIRYRNQKGMIRVKDTLWNFLWSCGVVLFQAYFITNTTIKKDEKFSYWRKN